jgi:hypothetical protein
VICRRLHDEDSAAEISAGYCQPCVIWFGLHSCNLSTCQT